MGRAAPPWSRSVRQGADDHEEDPVRRLRLATAFLSPSSNDADLTAQQSSATEEVRQADAAPQGERTPHGRGSGHRTAGAAFGGSAPGERSGEVCAQGLRSVPQRPGRPQAGPAGSTSRAWWAWRSAMHRNIWSPLGVRWTSIEAATAMTSPPQAPRR